MSTTNDLKTRCDDDACGCAPTSSRRAAWTYRPHTDVIDAADAVTLSLDLPGVDSSQIGIDYEAGMLSIQAPAPARFSPDVKMLRQEYGVGGFHRRFALEDGFDVDRIDATYRDGVLTVVLPKSAGAQRRRIPVAG